jgi:hypothetical protein
MTVADAWSVALAVLASLGGGGLIVASLSSWLGNVWASRILEKDRAKYATEIERLKADLDRATRQFQGEIEKTLFVTKTHFETEFQILREIWQEVSVVRASMAQLRPKTGIVDVRQTKEERLAECFQVYVLDVLRLIHTVDHNSPFYPKEIYETLDQLIHVAIRERDDIAVSGDEDTLSLAGRNRGKENFDQYLALAESFSSQVRGRLAKLSVRGTRAPNRLALVYREKIGRSG